tara:strand:+ start:519 stop:707 length:189 start_codon:yes stop_codon:yes gene_type:complete
MITTENPCKVIGIVGLGAVSGTIFALGCNIKDWKWISTFASIGCILGVSYMDIGKPFYRRFL